MTILLRSVLALLVVASAGAFDETRVTTIFAFDDVSIPSAQNLRLEMRRPERHSANPVVQRGGPGSVDAMGVQFYGSVIREGGRFRMWYVAYDDDVSNKVASSRWRAAYAESADGVRWVKPHLGLVEHRGSMHNNLVRTEPGPFGMVNLKVLLDVADPDPARRYKISTHVYFRDRRRLGTLAPFVSADGLRWKLLIDGAKPVKAELAKEDLVLPGVHFEPSGGLYQWEGFYYLCGQNAMSAPQSYQGRVARLYRSVDFVNWSETSSIAFIRGPQHGSLGAGRSLEGEQTHEGISVWNRGNVLLGIVGLWHGAKEWDDITVDLGFVLSNDGVHFREPAHEWTFLERGEDGQWDQGGLLQGQGFENIGEETFIYYGAWDPRARGEPRGGVGIAKLPRDRFGALVVEESGKGPGDYQLAEITSEFITADIAVPTETTHRFYLNVEGLGPDAALRVEMLDPLEQPLPEYSGDNAAIVCQSGFQTPVTWNGQTALTGLPDRIRLRMVFEGARRSEIRFSAIYVEAGDDW